MTGLQLALWLALAQTQEAPAPAEEAPAVEQKAEEAAPATAAEPAVPRAAAAPAVKGADEVAKLVQRWPQLSAPERTQALAELQTKYGQAAFNPVLPASDLDFDHWLKASETEQAGLVVRRFLTDLVALDVGAVMKSVGLPFALEDRRYSAPDELKDELARLLRSKRADLWETYDVVMLSPTDMEKKHGKPPARLTNWSWRAPKTLLAVCNVSGHAAVLLMRQVGATWQVTGYHD